MGDSRYQYRHAFKNKKPYKKHPAKSNDKLFSRQPSFSEIYIFLNSYHLQLLKNMIYVMAGVTVYVNLSKLSKKEIKPDTTGYKIYLAFFLHLTLVKQPPSHEEKRHETDHHFTGILIFVDDGPCTGQHLDNP
jgi:hypothetical protein